jgi:hypothetical protein
MNYASSYAVGGPALETRDDEPLSQALPAPKPTRIHWSTIVFTTGMVICAIALLVTIAGVPGALGYDIDAPPDRNVPDTNDPLALSRSIDGNLRWVAHNTNDEPEHYVGRIKSINRNELAIGAMVTALVSMNASVTAIDNGLAGLGASTAQMGRDIEAMSATSSTSAATMQALGSDIGFLSKSMVDLAGATEQLTTRMASIEKKAGGIAANGTSAALGNAKDLNASLPQGVPVPTTTDGEPYDQAMQRMATGGGGAVDDGARIQ